MWHPTQMNSPSLFPQCCLGSLKFPTPYICLDYILSVHVQPVTNCKNLISVAVPFSDVLHQNPSFIVIQQKHSKTLPYTESLSYKILIEPYSLFSSITLDDSCHILTKTQPTMINFVIHNVSNVTTKIVEM